MGKTRFKCGAGLLCSLLFAGCDLAGDGSTSSGSGQEPDPVVVDLPIAYIERPLPLDETGAFVPDALLEPATFNPGARVIVKARAQASAPEIDITRSVFAPAGEDEEPAADPVSRYDVKDLEVSPDGRKLLFAMRAPEIEGADEDDQPTWNIWEYDVELDLVRRVIASDIQAEQGHDVAPAYLPDGRIVFSSTRQRRTRALLLDENKPQYAYLAEDARQEAFVLHVMDADGRDIRQLTFNQSHDLQPTVLSDGRIAFLRWDNVAGRDRVSVYTINPDGSGQALLYGYHSQNTGPEDTEAVFTAPREMPDGRLLVTLKRRESRRWGGDIVAINTTDYTDNHQPTAANAGASGPAQESQAALPVLLDDAISPHGYFNGAAPLFDGTGRMLVSWSQCRLLDPETRNPTFCTPERLTAPDAEEADPIYSLWVYDPAGETQLPVVIAEEGIMVTEPAVLAPRPTPVYRAPGDCNADCDAGLGAVHIRSVYDFGEQTLNQVDIAAVRDPARTPAGERPARFLRIVKPVPRPENNLLDVPFNQAAGFSGGQNMREILGYVPIEPDGSVKFKVPADIAFAISVLDADGRRVGGAFGALGNRHQNWLSVSAGEVLECKGCHQPDSELPHGRPDAEPASLNPGAPTSGAPFSNTRLTDEFGTPHSGPEAGESMAEYLTRVTTADPNQLPARTPTVDILFEDEWAATAPLFSYSYAEVAARFDPDDPDAPQWTAPTQNCDSWGTLCRVVIHYPQHIQPLWEVSRPEVDDMGNLVGDNRCTGCHTETDSNDPGLFQVPAGQLELTRTSTFRPNTTYFTSYAELLRGDVEQETEDGAALANVLVETGEFERDEEGDLILDENGEPIPVLTTVPVPAPMSAAGARNSNRFFRVFDEPPEGDATVDHRTFLNASELKLIAEWLDIGGQYYNDPFQAGTN